MSSLASVPALRVLPTTALEALASQTRLVRFPAGAVLRPAGAVARSVVFLLSGTVVATHVRSTGAEMWPERWTAPAIVDKPAVLDGRPPSTGLLAMTTVSARLLPRAAFLRLLEEEQAVRGHVLGQLARDAMTARRRLAQVATMPAVARVARWLHEQNREQRVAWRGSQEQLARVLGLSRVTVNRALARLAQAGAVTLTDRGIVVADRARLDAIAGD
ncbi:Crp/Fnr family transcriptional regulator [Micromonospora endolithica]|uniref:Crp/Fnr family transcriptional regulator n=1 Tax=Micromonospora endolithica TaxID=230091 RepID=A0A3A9ZJK6_9ACTN|nr:Crp/Fnr family transcriptional regulator [Micromonospora endolithica]RKN48295.1 Crp/Fnr family transcriptional regulator [Micromonospora endolithica]TWJ24649.1 CRP-like cAMP-binding protein [Micromonospora endolithica]